MTDISADLLSKLSATRLPGLELGNGFLERAAARDVERDRTDALLEFKRGHHVADDLAIQG